MKTIQNPQNGLSGAEVLHRAEDCSAKGLCFISLKPLAEEDAVSVEGVYVHKKYVNK